MNQIFTLYANNKASYRAGYGRPDYETLVQQASAKVSGFARLYKELERSVSISGKSTSTLVNYGWAPRSNCP